VGFWKEKDCPLVEFFWRDFIKKGAKFWRESGTFMQPNEFNISALE
jgi:hypothetical protein